MRNCVVTLCVLLSAGASAFGKAGDYLGRPDAWFAGDEARRIAGNILSYQSPLGGWPKNTNTTTSPYRGAPEKLSPTFDNGATTDEMRFLARMHAATNEAKYRDAFLRGLSYILKAQYPTGGWPQSYPPGGQYHRHITFNDDAMVRLMRFLREVATDDRYAFVDAERRGIAAVHVRLVVPAGDVARAVATFRAIDAASRRGERQAALSCAEVGATIVEVSGGTAGGAL
jgi:hypothetical protein